MSVSNNSVVAAMIAAVAAFMTMEYASTKQREFAAWRVRYMANLTRVPGKREFLRDQMIREEFREATHAD